MSRDILSPNQLRYLRECREARYQFPAFAWPGGYPVFYLTRRNDILCPACAAKSFADWDRVSIILALGFGDPDQDAPDWQWELGSGEMMPEVRDLPEASDAHWEGEPLACDECQEDIESAYGIPETQDTEAR